MDKENLATIIEQFKSEANEIDLAIYNHVYIGAMLIEKKAKMETLDYVVRELEELL